MNGKIKIHQRIGAALAISAIVFSPFFGIPPRAHADTGFGLSITPPLFKISLSPGEHWASSIKVMNVASEGDITVYASVANFAAQGEGGQGRFTPMGQGPSPDGLPLWIAVPGNGVTVHAAQSADLPFSIDVPAGASPGGHYAAILIGTKPYGGPAQGATVAVASYISSLIFVRVAGDVHEEGSIKELSVDKNFYETPDVNLALRFANIGNVDLEPQGAITIYNMWGKEQGSIPVNQADNFFGNVLPQSVRRFDFHWQSDAGLFDFGRYTAVATLAYGQTEKHNVTVATAFWVVPVIPLIETLAGMIILIIAFVWAIRRYVGKILRDEMTMRNMSPAARHVVEEQFSSSVLDLRTQVTAPPPRPAAHSSFIKRYLVFLVLIPVLLVVLMAVYVIISQLTHGQRDITVSPSEGTVQSP